MRKGKKQIICQACKLAGGLLFSAAIAAGGLLLYGTDADAAVKAESVSVKASNSVLGKGTTIYTNGPSDVAATTLKVEVEPAKASKKVTFKSSNKKVAEVSNAGKVTARKTGTAVVKVTAAGNKKASAKIKITVKKYVYPTAMSVKASKTSLKQGEISKLSVSFKPAKTSLKNVTYKSSNKSLATVSSKGVVKANVKKKAGTVKITVNAVPKTKAGKTLSATVKIKVSAVVPKLQKIRFDSNIAYIGLTGESDTTTEKLPSIVTTPASAQANVTYSCDDTDVLTVDSKGRMTAKRLGKVTVTADAGNGITATCSVFITRSNRGIHDPSVYRDPVSGK